MRRSAAVRDGTTFHLASATAMDVSAHVLRCPFHLVSVRAGAGGLELVFSVRHRGMGQGWSHLKVTLAGSGMEPLEGAAGRAGGVPWR